MHILSKKYHHNWRNSNRKLKNSKNIQKLSGITFYIWNPCGHVYTYDLYEKGTQLTLLSLSLFIIYNDYHTLYCKIRARLITISAIANNFYCSLNKVIINGFCSSTVSVTQSIAVVARRRCAARAWRRHSTKFRGAPLHVYYTCTLTHARIAHHKPWPPRDGRRGSAAPRRTSAGRPRVTLAKRYAAPVTVPAARRRRLRRGPTLRPRRPHGAQQEQKAHIRTSREYNYFYNFYQLYYLPS